MGGTGMADTIRLHDKQVKLLQIHSYFLNKQAASPLHAAVVTADVTHTPLDLLQANENELATDEEYNNKIKRQWAQTPLHGRHPHDLSQKTCRHRSVEQMAAKRGPVRRNRGLSNGDTGPSDTNKKLQQVYFEAAKH
jgi:hypothetical protein